MYLHNFTCSIVHTIKGLPLKFFIFLCKIPLEPERAGIMHKIYMSFIIYNKIVMNK